MKHLPDCHWVDDTRACDCADRIFWASATDEERQQIIANRRTVPEWAGGGR